MTIRGAILVLVGCNTSPTPEPDAESDADTVSGITSLATVAIPGGATDVSLSQSQDQVLALGLNDLWILDVSTPESPSTVNKTGWGGLGLHRVEDTLYIATGMTVIEATLAGTPPTLLQEHTFGTRAANRIFVVQRRAYVASNADLLVLDLDRDPPLLATLGMGDTVNDITVIGDLVCAAVGKVGLVVLDGAESPATADRYQIETEGIALAVFPLSDTTLLVGASQEVVTFEIADPTHPERLSRHALEGRVHAVTGDFSYVIGAPCKSHEPPGFHVLDIADRRALREVSCTPTDLSADVRSIPTHGRGFAVFDGLIALAADNDLRFLQIP